MKPRFSTLSFCTVLALIGLLQMPGLVVAAVTSTGKVNPDPSLDPEQPNTELRIGDDFQGDAEDVDPRATVTVDGGTLFDFHQVFVGYETGFFGRMEVSGAGTRVQLNDGGANSDAALEVGRLSNGYFSLTDGATLQLTSSTGDIVVASDAGSIGEMWVDGGTTFVDLEGDILVGDAGAAQMTISGGALVRTTGIASLISIGDKAAGSGLLLVDGNQTTLQAGGDLTIGNAGIGELHITGDALVDADNTGSAQASVGTLGRVYLSHGTLDVRDINVSGYLGGHGVVRGQVDVTGGDVEVGSGERLNIEDAFNNGGDVTITGGELRLLDAATTTVAGSWALQDGALRFSQPHTNNGVIASSEDTNNIHGPITNNGTVVVASETIAVFHDSYTDTGTTTVLARGNALFLDDLTFTSASLISLDIASEDGTNQSAQLEVAGQANLAGELALNFTDDFLTSNIQPIELLYADGGITGAFVPPIFPTVEGLAFDLVYGANSVVLDVSIDNTNFFDGDFNRDGFVDSTDYTIWRDGLGTTYSQNDYLAWKENFGRVSSGPLLSSSLPEPGSLTLFGLLIAITSSVFGRHR